MGTNVNLAVIYYSSTGTGTNIAAEISSAAEHLGADVRLRQVNELAPQSVIDAVPAWAAHHTAHVDRPRATLDDVEWADAVIFGSPTRFGNIASQLKQFFDTLSPLWISGNLAEKVYSGFTSAGTRHGGHETTLLAMYNSIHHFGGVIVPPGSSSEAKQADGNPYGTSHHAEFGGVPGAIDEVTAAAARHQAVRVVQIASALKTGRQAQHDTTRD